MDYYAILQVSPTAEPDVIDTAYHRLKQKYEPLEHDSSQARERMASLREAYEVLHDPIRRKWYDRARTAESTLPSESTPPVAPITPPPTVSLPTRKRGTHWLWYLSFIVLGVLVIGGHIVYSLESDSTNLAGATLAAIAVYIRTYAFAALILLFSIWLWLRTLNFYAQHPIWAWALRILALIWIINTVRGIYDVTLRSAEALRTLNTSTAPSNTSSNTAPTPNPIPTLFVTDEEISWTVAKNHIHEIRPVCGEVVAIGSYSDPVWESTVLYMDPPSGTSYTFAIFIPKHTLGRFPGSIESLYLHKNVCSIGPIQADGTSTLMWVDSPDDFYIKQ